MTVKLANGSIDLAIVTANPEAMTAFYRDVLGLEDVGQMATRSTPGGMVRQLLCGTTTIKLVTYADPPPTRAPVGGPGAATGYRYWAIHVTNLEEVVAACEGAGRPIVVPIKEISPGIRIAMVEDPDGNWVEFLTTS